MINNLFFSALLIIFFWGCSSSMDTSKLDATLIKKMKEIENTNPETKLAIFIKIKNKLDEKSLEEIKKTGIEIETVVENIITAKATVPQIRELSKKEIVEKIELSIERKLNN